MLVGVDIPTTGCWELEATQRGASLAYVVWIPGSQSLLADRDPLADRREHLPDHLTVASG